MVGGKEVTTTQQVTWQFSPGEPLDYSDHANITKYNDFLDNDIIDTAITEADKIGRAGQYDLRTSKAWHPRIVKNSAPVLIARVKDQAVLDNIEKHVKDKIGDYSINPMYYYWTQLSYIPWHNDGDHKGALTIYLLDQDVDAGGYFMYDDGKGIKAIRPMRNRAVLQQGGIYHCVSTVNVGYPTRITMQVWLS